MSKVFRVMQEEGGRPKPGSSATTLGVRLPGGPGWADIEPDACGMVRPGTGGMSVSPSLRDLPPHRVPRRLRHFVLKAKGDDRCFVWSMGAGPFVRGPVAPDLELRPDPDNSSHGFVEPARDMSLEEYQRALQATQHFWYVEED